MWIAYVHHALDVLMRSVGVVSVQRKFLLHEVEELWGHIHQLCQHDDVMCVLAAFFFFSNEIIDPRKKTNPFVRWVTFFKNPNKIDLKTTQINNF